MSYVLIQNEVNFIVNSEKPIAANTGESEKDFANQVKWWDESNDLAKALILNHMQNDLFLCLKIVRLQRSYWML